MRALLFALILPLTGLLSAQVGAQNQNCRLSYRPGVNETAFVPVGAALKVADELCLETTLIIPFAQDAAAVHLPAGEYAQLSFDANAAYFSLKSHDGKEISSCLLCDPLQAALIFTDRPQELCVKSTLGIVSCAPRGRLSFAAGQNQRIKENICTPTLIYHGRSGNELHFALNDCSAKSQPTLTFDLSLGHVIRFLHDSYDILQADNQGITYRYLGARP